MTHPISDNCCARMGWIEYHVDLGGFDLHVSVHPKADLGGEVECFCHDDQKMILSKKYSCQVS